MIISASSDLIIMKLYDNKDESNHRAPTKIHKLNVTKNMVPDNLFVSKFDEHEAVYTIELNEFRIRSKNVILIEKLYEILLGDLKEKSLEDVLPEITL